MKALYEAGVIVRELPGRGILRASCGYWTSDGDLDRLLDALRLTRPKATSRCQAP